jgi:nitrite reductase (NO-forming)
VRITLENGDGMMHDLAIPDLHVQTATALSEDSVVEVTFRPTESGSYVYFCTVSGHRQAGMEGTLVVTASES